MAEELLRVGMGIERLPVPWGVYVDSGTVGPVRMEEELLVGAGWLPERRSSVPEGA